MEIQGKHVALTYRNASMDSHGSKMRLARATLFRLKTLVYLSNTCGLYPALGTRQWDAKKGRDNQHPTVNNSIQGATLKQLDVHV